MGRRFLIPLFASFISTYLLGALFAWFFLQMHWIVPSPNADLLDVIGYLLLISFLLPYLIVVVVSFLAFRKDRVFLAVIVVSPILLTALLICGIYLFLKLSGGAFVL